MNPCNTTFWLGSCCATLFLMLLPTPFTAGQPASTGKDEVILSGFLSCPHAKDASCQCPPRYHYVNLNQGTTYTIRIESTEFNARLTLENLEGKLLASESDWIDEDIFGCILFRPPTTGSYRLVVTASPPLREGFYTVVLRELPVLMRVEAALTTNDVAQNHCYHKSQEVSLVAGRRYLIEMESDQFEGCVKLTNSDGAIVAFADEGTAEHPARLLFEAPQTATYRLVAASATPGALGAFKLTVCGE